MLRSIIGYFFGEKYDIFIADVMMTNHDIEAGKRKVCRPL